MKYALKDRWLRFRREEVRVELFGQMEGDLPGFKAWRIMASVPQVLLGRWMNDGQGQQILLSGKKAITRGG